MKTLPGNTKNILNESTYQLFRPIIISYCIIDMPPLLKSTLFQKLKQKRLRWWIDGKKTEIVCKCVVSAGEFEIVGAGNDPVDRFPMPEFVLLLRAGAMFSVEHSGLSVYSVFVRGRLRRPVVSLRNPGRILSDTALRGPGFAGVAVGEGPGSGGDRIKNSTTGIIFIKNNYLC